MIAARDLPDTDNTFFNISRGDWTDPFVTVNLDQVELLKTSYLENCLDPVWDEVFTVPVCHHANSLKVRVMDREHVGAEVVGTILISTDDIMSGEELEGWFDLLVSAGGDVQGAVHISFQLFPPCTLYQGKVLQDGYFPERWVGGAGHLPRAECRVTMYQDADTPALPCFQGVARPDGSQYLPPR